MLLRSDLGRRGRQFHGWCRASPDWLKDLYAQSLSCVKEHAFYLQGRSARCCLPVSKAVSELRTQSEDNTQCSLVGDAVSAGGLPDELQVAGSGEIGEFFAGCVFDEVDGSARRTLGPQKIL